MKKTHRIIGYGAAVLFWIVLWQVCAMALKKPLLLPSFTQTLSRLAEMVITSSYWVNVLTSFVRIFAGILAAILLGTLTGIFSGRYTFLHILLEPVLAVLRSTPVASFIVLLILWMNRDFVPAVVALVTVLPIMHAGCEEGFRSIDPKLKEVGKVFHMDLMQKVKGIYLPGIRPYFTASVKSSLGMGWKSCIAAEVITLPMVSIGRSMYNASNNLDTAGTFAWTLTIILLSLLVNAFVLLITDRRKKKKAATGGREEVSHDRT